MTETITVDEFHARLKAQGVSREHVAFKCPICGTVQSMSSLIASGAAPDKVENSIGFSCEGRFNNAGPWPNDPKKRAKRTKRGCDWSLGGLFRIHKLEVQTPDGEKHPRFEIATPEEAQALAKDAVVQ